MFCCYVVLCIFFFKQKTAYEMRISDWSSDVCSSDLVSEITDGSQAQARDIEQINSGFASMDENTEQNAALAAASAAAAQEMRQQAGSLDQAVSAVRVG